MFGFRLVASPAEQMPLFNMALRDFVEHRDAAYLEEHPDLWIGVKGHLGSHHVTPRGLSARLLGKLVIIQGIVTKCSLVRPKVHKSVHYCPSTGKQVTREYHDATSFVAAPTGSTYPTEVRKKNNTNLVFPVCRLRVFCRVTRRTKKGTSLRRSLVCQRIAITRRLACRRYLRQRRRASFRAPLMSFSQTILLIS